MNSEDSSSRHVQSGPLAGSALKETFTLFLSQIHFEDLQSVSQITPSDFLIRFFWCNPINCIIKFMEDAMKISVATAFHDAMKLVVNRLFLDGQAIIEVQAGQKRIDLIEKTQAGEEITHEVKTIEFKSQKKFLTTIKRYLEKILEDIESRKVWWFIFLKESKNIYNRPCFTYLGVIRVGAEQLRVRRENKRKRKTEIEEIKEGLEHAEKAVIKKAGLSIEELDGEFLFGTENKITQNLRAKNQKLEAKLAKQQKEYEEKLDDQHKFYEEKLDDQHKFYEEKLDDQQKFYEEKLADQQKFYDEKLADQHKFYEEKLDDQQKFYEEKLADQHKFYEEKLDDQHKFYEEKLTIQQIEHQKEIGELKDIISNLMRDIDGLKKKLL